MNGTRRGTLATGAAALSIGMGGCLATFGENTNEKGETLATTTVLVEQPSGEDGDPIVTDGLTIHDEAKRRAWAFNSPDDLENVNRERLRAIGESRAVTVAEKTDFSSAILVVVQVVLPSRDLTLRLDRAVARGGTVTVEVAADSPDNSGGAAETELATLFVRCSRDGVSTIETVRVEYKGPGPEGSFEARM